MSEQKNVRTIQEIYDAFGRRDVQAILDRLTDDVQWITHLDPVVPWSGNYCGKEDVKRFFANVYGAGEVLAFEPLEFVAEGDMVISIGKYGCRSAATGKEAHTRWIFVWKFRNGQISYYEQFHDIKIADAFRA